MNSARTILVGRDHTLGETLDRIASGLSECGYKVKRIPMEKQELHWQIALDDRKWLQDVSVIVVSSRTRINEQIFDLAPLLRGVVFPSIGFNSCDIDLAAERGVMVVNGVTPENYESMAESTVMLMSALMLELNRKQQRLRNMLPGLPVSRMTSRMIKGKTVGLIGYGRIARETIRRLQGWGVEKFMVFTRSKPRSSMSDVGFCALEELLLESDIVSIHCPLNDQTRNLIGKKELKAMKRDSVLVNTSRGGIIDEHALYAALRDGVISAAAIDTFLEEPLAADSPLRELENIYLTQHNIGHTRELFDSLVPRAIQNVMILLDGGMPEHTVNSRMLSEKLTLSERLDEYITH